MRRHAAICALIVGGLLAARPGSAQCGATRSSCSGCHDGKQALLPDGREAWHGNHAFADLCPTCHGGHGDSDDAAQAHSGLVEALANVEPCGSCHGASAQPFLERYRTTQHRDAAAASRGARIGPGGLGAPSPVSQQFHAHGETGPNRAMAAVIAAVGVLGALFVVRQERAREGGTS